MDKPDEIRREIVVDAPIERVWRAISTPDEVAQWFGDVTEFETRAGSRAVFGWTEFGQSFEAEIVTVEEPFRFGYRWALEASKSLEDSHVTSVEFTLERVDGSTRLTLVESGFSAIPDDEHEQHFGENSKGWTAELEDLRLFLAGVRPVA